MIFLVIWKTIIDIYLACDRIICVGDFNVDVLNINSGLTLRTEKFNLVQYKRTYLYIRIFGHRIGSDICWKRMRCTTQWFCRPWNIGSLSCSLQYELTVAHHVTFSCKSLKNINRDLFQYNLKALPLDNIRGMFFK